jgi:hypothetical protein
VTDSHFIKPKKREMQLCSAEKEQECRLFSSEMLISRYRPCCRYRTCWIIDVVMPEIEGRSCWRQCGVGGVNLTQSEIES